MQALQVLVVGGGIAGLSTAWHAARRGARVTLVERLPATGLESSAKSAGILRTVGSDPLTGALARRSAAFLLAPPASFCETPLVEPVGLVLTGPRGALDGLARDGFVRELSREEFARRAPHWRGPAEETWLAPRDGRIAIEGVLAAFERAVRAEGVEVRTNAPVTGLLREAGAVRGARLAGGEELPADVTVLAAGAWAGELGRQAGSRVVLRPTRRHLWVSGPEARIDPRSPIVWRLGQEFYLRPEAGGFLACACEIDEVDPDDCAADPSVRERIAAGIAENTPGLAAAPEARFWCGMRTLTADGRFAVGPDPGVRGLFWVAGLGGWGMTCGAEVGRLAGELLLGGEIDPAERAALDPARLAQE